MNQADKQLLQRIGLGFLNFGIRRTRDHDAAHPGLKMLSEVSFRLGCPALPEAESKPARRARRIFSAARPLSASSDAVVGGALCRRRTCLVESVPSQRLQGSGVCRFLYFVFGGR